MPYGGQLIGKIICYKRKCFDAIVHVAVIVPNLARILVLSSVMRRIVAKDCYCQKIRISGINNGSELVEIKTAITCT